MPLRLFKRTKRKTKRESTASTASASSSSSNTNANEITQHPNTSTSNLSTVSTLYDAPEEPAPTPAGITSHSAYLSHAHSSEVRQARLARAWAKAEERRRLADSRSWPHDPWRGGFGPPSHARAYYGTNERREWAGSDGGVRGWLGQNGWVRN